MLEQLLPQLITAILTAVITLGGVYLANRYQRKTEEDKFNRVHKSEKEMLKKEQLEELYLLFSKWDADLKSLAHLCFEAHRGVNLTEHPFITADKNKLSEKDDFYRIMMMIELRFSELLPSFNKILDERAKVMNFCNENLPTGYNLENMAVSLDSFHDRSQAFKQELVLKAAQNSGMKSVG